ncbi:MAG: isoprenylcysteine carboxylmethyltransferase family protein [Chthoniobacteraceae bacterium]
MKFLRRTLSSVGLVVVIFGGLLFLPAWTWHWERAWTLLAASALGTVITMLVAFRGDEALFKERKSGLFQKDQPLADKLVVAPLIGSYYAQLVLCPLDVWHWHLLPVAGPVATTAGVIMAVVGWTVITLVFRENTFAAPVVKHMKERHQKVIDTGVYAVVRHPMYAGAILWIPGMALWLGSWAGALFAVVPTVLFMVRIGVEEQFLRQELPGYVEYTQRVKYRLLPGVW